MPDIRAAVVLLFSVSPVYAEMVTNSVQLPASGIPASGYNPPCGNTEFEAQNADVVLGGISGGIDYLIGAPVTTSIIEAFGGTGDFLARLNLHNGKSACQTLCVGVPRGQAVSYQTCMSGPDGKPYDCTIWSPNPADAAGVWDWGVSINPSIASRGETTVFCATGKNWIHDQARWFQVSAEY